MLEGVFENCHPVCESARTNDWQSFSRKSRQEYLTKNSDMITSGLAIIHSERPMFSRIFNNMLRIPYVYMEGSNAWQTTPHWLVCKWLPQTSSLTSIYNYLSTAREERPLGPLLSQISSKSIKSWITLNPYIRLQLKKKYYCNWTGFKCWYTYHLSFGWGFGYLVEINIAILNQNR